MFDKKIWSKKYYLDNIEKFKKHHRQYYKNNREKEIERSSKWAKNNPSLRAIIGMII